MSEEMFYYKVIDFQGNVVPEMIMRSDKAWIPCNEANSDYQVYLAWVAEGNTAEQWTLETNT